MGDLRGASAVAGQGGGGPTNGGSSAGELPSSDAGSPPEASAGSAGTDETVSAFDDFEHEDSVILELDGRKGDWYVSNDGRGTQSPRAGAELLPTALDVPREGSSSALHTFGGPFFTWGALVGASLASGEGYDLSGYAGIRLWVRSGASSGAWGAPSAAREVRLNLTTTATSAGGSCTVCNDHFGVDIPLTMEWALVDLPLAGMKQAGFGRPQLKVDLSEVVDIQLTFPANVSFDLWVDDVELYR